MVTAFDVSTQELIEEIAREFAKNPAMKAPAWAVFVKTGQHVERAPQRKDWWQVRQASILYRVFADGPVGTGSLRSYYGGRRNRGVKPHHFRRASGKIIRLCLQQLEKEGLIKKAKKGRVISAKGESFLNKKAKEIAVKWLEGRAKREEEAKARLFKKAEQKAAAKAVHDELKKLGKKERPEKGEKDKAEKKKEEK